MSNNKILLVEDDDVDAMTVKRAMKELKLLNPLNRATNGLEALDFLEKNLNELPTMILLDINMPKMNGIEFLEAYKKDPRFQRIPSIILTTSKEDTDRLRSFNLSAAGYMVKPVHFADFVEVMRTINMYWTLSEKPG